MPKKRLIGKVVSNKMDKTIVVSVDELVRHSFYGKPIKKSTKFHAHDENNSCGIGDLVEIEECKPISKSKAFTLVQVLKKDVYGLSTSKTPENVETSGGEK